MENKLIYTNILDLNAIDLSSSKVENKLKSNFFETLRKLFF